jgi:hypothetical protein
MVELWQACSLGEEGDKVKMWPTMTASRGLHWVQAGWGLVLAVL